MAISYSISIDRDSDGLDEPAEDITPHVLEAHWRLGMAAAYDSVSAPGWARIVVQNRGRDFSPEWEALPPGLRLRIHSDDGQQSRLHFTGYIERVEPLPGDRGPQRSTIHVRGPERWLEQCAAQGLPMGMLRADEAIAAVLDAAPLRRDVLAGYCVVGAAGYSELDEVRLFGPGVAHSLQEGRSSFAHMGDTWPPDMKVARAIASAAEAERGRFFFDRGGQAVFYNRHHTLTSTTPAAAFSDDMEGLDYSYGRGVVNGVQVALRPRAMGPPGVQLWSTTSVQPLTPGLVYSFYAAYQDEEGRLLSAVEVERPRPGLDYGASTRKNGSGTDATGDVRVVLREAGRRAARLEVRSEGRSMRYLQHLRLRGRPLLVQEPLIVEVEDAVSRTFYGPGLLALDLPALDDIDLAGQIARYELARRSSPRGLVHSLSASTRGQAAAVLGLTLFDRITISESQTGHSADYFIIAEEHHVDRGGTRHRVTWPLEAADDDLFVIVGSSHPDGTRVLAY